MGSATRYSKRDAQRRTVDAMVQAILPWFFVIVKRHDLTGLVVIALLWVIGIWSQYANTRYRIFWKNGDIEQIAANKNITVLKTAEIKRIALEHSDIRTLLSYTRPSRRIAIYAQGPDGNKWIDVSLKHFAPEDIRQLMRAIHERRPDLSMPKGWI
jgi:hypothetical protein